VKFVDTEIAAVIVVSGAAYNNEKAGQAQYIADEA
jgi:hypothetical protein